MANECRKVWQVTRFARPASMAAVLTAPLNHGLVEMLPSHLSGPVVTVGAMGGDEPLPGPFATGVGVLHRQRAG